MVEIKQDLSVATYTVKIYMSGPIDIAKQVLREDCYAQGLCVTIEPTTFIYTGGEETGFVVGLLNYPRFPSASESLLARGISITKKLMERTFQHSALILDPVNSRWLSSRANYV